MRPPIGVEPFLQWYEANPNPDLGELLDRYNLVNGAINRYRDAGLDVPTLWLFEVLGVHYTQSQPQQVPF